MAQQELCFIAFPIVPLTESFNNDQKLSEETHLFLKGALSMSERREVRYPVSSLNFLEGDLFDSFIITIITIVTNLRTSAMSTDANKFSADLVVDLILLPTPASLAISDNKFLANRVRFV